jgi:hypothetical protein
MEGYMFFMNNETATDTLNEGICFGIGEARYSDEQEEVDDWRDRLDELEREEYYESKYGKEQEC